jgi:CDP-diacylglycerol--serine O-phosphatidyltransferase
MKPVAMLPSLCTLGNAFCGFLAIAKGADAIGVLWQGEHPPLLATRERFHDLFETGCYLLFLANLFDALDGRLARMTKATSEFGAMLDSLADMTTFGAAPALMLKFLYESERRIAEEAVIPKLVFLVAFLYAACAALRLARFTAETDDDPESHDFFKGLPTPAAAAFVASGMLVYVHLDRADTPAWLAQHRSTLLFVLLASLPLLALLMVSKVKYVHVVNRYLRGRQPRFYVATVALLLLLVWLVPQYALVILCMGYVAACPLVALLEKLLHRPLWPAPPPAPPSEGATA